MRPSAGVPRKDAAPERRMEDHASWDKEQGSGGPTETTGKPGPPFPFAWPSPLLTAPLASHQAAPTILRWGYWTLPIEELLIDSGGALRITSGSPRLYSPSHGRLLRGAACLLLHAYCGTRDDSSKPYIRTNRAAAIERIESIYRLQNLPPAQNMVAI